MSPAATKVVVAKMAAAPVTRVAWMAGRLAKVGFAAAGAIQVAPSAKEGSEAAADVAPALTTRSPVLRAVVDAELASKATAGWVMVGWQVAWLVPRARCTQRHVSCRCCCHLHCAGTAAQSEMHRPLRAWRRLRTRQAAPKSTPRGGRRPLRSARSSQPPGTAALPTSGRPSGAAISALAQSRRRGGGRSATCRPSHRRRSQTAAPSGTATAVAAWQVVAR